MLSIACWPYTPCSSSTVAEPRVPVAGLRVLVSLFASLLLAVTRCVSTQIDNVDDDAGVGVDNDDDVNDCDVSPVMGNLYTLMTPVAVPAQTK